MGPSSLVEIGRNAAPGAVLHDAQIFLIVLGNKAGRKTVQGLEAPMSHREYGLELRGVPGSTHLAKFEVVSQGANLG